MDKKKVFGRRNWFIKMAIYNMLLEDKDYFGIDAIVYNDKIVLTDKDKEIRYQLCNIIRSRLLDGGVTATDIMAVLYKIDFAIVEGKLKNSLEFKNMQEDREIEGDRNYL